MTRGLSIEDLNGSLEGFSTTWEAVRGLVDFGLSARNSNENPPSVGQGRRQDEWGELAATYSEAFSDPDTQVTHEFLLELARKEPTSMSIDDVAYALAYEIDRHRWTDFTVEWVQSGESERVLLNVSWCLLARPG